MQETLFPELSGLYFQPIVVASYDSVITENTYTFLDDLNVRFSLDGSWQSLSTETDNVTADIIPLDSSIPLKAANPIRKASGDLPKVATRRQLNESGLTSLQLLNSSGLYENQVKVQLFEHTPKVIKGQMEEFERLYLEGLSTGQILVDVDTNVGSGTRVDFGYVPENKGFASTVWGQTNYTPISDIEAMIEKANQDGNVIEVARMDRATFNLIRMSDEAKAYFNPLADKQPSLNFDQLNAVFQTNLGISIKIIERTVRTEKDGVRTTIKPWKAGQIILTPNQKTGDFVWTRLAEMDFPVGGVMYQRTGAQDFILVKKYRNVEPALSENTASESRALPVISNVHEIYTLDTTATA